MPRRPPKDPLQALAYHLAYEAGQKQFRLEHPELEKLFDELAESIARTAARDLFKKTYGEVYDHRLDKKPAKVERDQ